MADKVYCSERVYGESFSGQGCSRRMVIICNGKPYCGIHDPAKVAARNAKRDKQYQEKRKREADIEASVRALIKALGVGTPDYNFNRHGYTGSIILTADEAQRLIVRLERMRG